MQLASITNVRVECSTQTGIQARGLSFPVIYTKKRSAEGAAVFLNGKV